MTAQASREDIGRLVKNVDQFMQKYAELKSPDVRAAVSASQNSEIMREYANTLAAADGMKRTIDSTVGAWDAFKRAYGRVTDTTSMYIGDAIDEIRSWFGYDPAPGIGEMPIFAADVPGSMHYRGLMTGNGLGALSAVPVIAAAVAVGVAGAAYIINKQIDNFMVMLQAWRIRSNDPTISQQRALAIATSSVKKSWTDNLKFPVLIGAVALGYFILRNKR